MRLQHKHQAHPGPSWFTGKKGPGVGGTRTGPDDMAQWEGHHPGGFRGKDESGCRSSATSWTSRDGKARRTTAGGSQGKPVRETSRTRKSRGYSRELGVDRGRGGSPARGMGAAGTGPLATLPLWRTGESERLLRRKKENPNPALENWSVGNLNPLCKGKRG